MNHKERKERRVSRILSDTHKKQVSLRFVNLARNFFKKIGLPFQIVDSGTPDPADAFFKGCWIADSRLYFCPSRVQVGELLHEAGHLALMPKDRWHLLGGKIDIDSPSLGGFGIMGDLAVEAWDYAAAIKADIPILAVFDKGFDGMGLQVWESFDEKAHPGFACLQALGMSSEWGMCEKWFIGDRSIADGEDGFVAVLEKCTKIQEKILMDLVRRTIREAA